MEPDQRHAHFTFMCTMFTTQCKNGKFSLEISMTISECKDISLVGAHIRHISVSNDWLVNYVVKVTSIVEYCNIP